jgi:hypothetical protein
MIEALLFRLRADSVGLTLGPHKVRFELADGTRKNRGLDWIASASVSMEGCHRDSVSGEHSRP